MRIGGIRPGPAMLILLGLLNLLALLLGACSQDDVAGGTGTITGNTISARVVDERGVPVPGARMGLRPADFLPDSVRGSAEAGADGVDTAVTDSSGRFVLKAEAGKTYLLEGVAGKDSGVQVAWSKGIQIDGSAAGTDLEEIVLHPASSLSGTLSFPTGDPMHAGETVWAGFAGTARFSKVGQEGSFSLDGIPQGGHELLILRHRPQEALRTFRVEGWKMLSGTRAVLDTVRLPMPGSGPDLLQALACVEGKGAMAKREYPGPPIGGSTAVIRTMLNTSPPQWVELDPCLGSWRAVHTLPGKAAGMSGSGSDGNRDYILLKGIGEMLSLGPTAGDTATLPLPSGLLNLEFHRGRIYALFAGDSALRAFPDFGALSAGVPDEILPLGVPVSDLWDLAIRDSLVYFTTPGDSGRLQQFDLRSRHYGSHAVLTDFGGAFFGITSAPQNRLWLLNDKAELMLYDPAGHQVLKRVAIAAPQTLRGLTRFQEGE